MTRRRQRWSIQVDEYPKPGEKMFGPRTIVDSHPKIRDYATSIPVENTEVDEIFIDSWFHLEAMDRGVYWLNVAGIVLTVSVDKKGKPTLVTVEHEERDGVTYQ